MNFGARVFIDCNSKCDEFVISSYDVVDENTHLALAHHMYRSGNFKEALEHSTTVYERNPNRTDNLLLLGAIYYQVVFSYKSLKFSVSFIVLYVLNVNGRVGVRLIRQCTSLCCLESENSDLLPFFFSSFYIWFLQLQDFEMCISKNEEALRVEPHFAECYGNMANAWKVCWINDHLNGLLKISVANWLGIPFMQEKGNIDLAIRYYLIAIEVCVLL